MSQLDEKIISLYKGTVQIRYTEANHAYWLLQKPKMKRLTGVTSFTGKVIDKSDFLISWALELTADYLEAHQDEMRGKKADLAAIFESAKVASQVEKERAIEIGKGVHAWIEAHANGNTPEMPTDPKVLQGVLAFVEWAEQNKVKFLWSERIVYSKKHGYVGTADAGLKLQAGPLKGMTVLGDYKVSNGLYPAVKMQTAAYQGALQEENPKEKFDGRLAIRISAETPDEYMERMTKKWEKRGYKIPIPTHKPFEAKFFPAETFKRDYLTAMAAWEIIQWNRVAEQEMRAE
jgi:hypothetical protein